MHNRGFSSCSGLHKHIYINQDIWIANCHLLINKLLNIYIAENNCLIAAAVVFLISDG